MFISYQLKDHADGCADFSPLTLNLVSFQLLPLQQLESILRLLKLSFKEKQILTQETSQVWQLLKSQLSESAWGCSKSDSEYLKSLVF